MTFVEPKTADVGLQETVVFEVFTATDSVNAPEDGKLFVFPPYLAVTVTGELAEAEVYVTEQVPLERLHETPENFPEPLLDSVTLPVGEEPVTVALHLTGEPTTTEVVGGADVVEVEVEVV